MKFLKEQEELCRQLGNTEGLKASLENQVEIEELIDNKLKDNEMEKIKEQNLTERNRKESLAVSLSNQAKKLVEEGKFEKALNIYREQEMIYKELNHPMHFAECKITQSAIMAKLGNKMQAFSVLREAYQIAMDYDFQDLASEIKRLFDDIENNY